MRTSLGRKDNFAVLRYCAVGSSVGLEGGKRRGRRGCGGEAVPEPHDLVSGVEIDWTGLGWNGGSPWRLWGGARKQGMQGCSKAREDKRKE
jgi:hypothetical protein